MQSTLDLDCVVPITRSLRVETPTRPKLPPQRTRDSLPKTLRLVKWTDSLVDFNKNGARHQLRSQRTVDGIN